MPSDLRSEIKQTKPFRSLYQEAGLALQRTAASVAHAHAEAFKPFGISGAQYNVLRILRGAGEAGLCRNEVGERLVTKVPDVTRLIDRLEDRGLVERTREGADRRFVTTRITAAGRELLAEIEAPLIELEKRVFGHMSDEQLRSLIDLLALTRKAG